MTREGKEAREFMERVVYSSLGKSSARVRVRPGVGLDNGIVSVGPGRVMILTVDPVSVIPAFGMKLSAWLSVHLIASDYTSSGKDPEYAIFSFNFPSTMNSADKEEYIRSIGSECRRLGISIVGGHTGTYPGGGFSVVGAGTMLGFSDAGSYVTPAMARAGDSILITKHAAIEATGSLALAFPDFVEKELGPRLSRRAKNEIKLASTVKDARTAKLVGLGNEGASSMHDATEGGVLGGLDEMSTAASLAFHVDLEKVPVSEEASAVCCAFGLNPLRTMGEGALLITCNPMRVSELEGKMSQVGIPLSQIGQVRDGKGLIIQSGKRRASRYAPGPDRYWQVYSRALRRRLR
jgi:hydrogenase expression/formation protein HypE